MNLDDPATPEGAAVQATRLKTYWARRGYDIKTWFEVIETATRNGGVACVRSTLVNGLPPRGPIAAAELTPELPTASVGAGQRSHAPTSSTGELQ
jgi:hypothetical protein